MKSSKNEIKTVLQLVLTDETGDSYHRMRWPAKHLCQQEYSLRIINLDARARERFEWAEQADLLVLYQSMDYCLLPVIERRKKRGLKTLVEYNDNFYAPPACSPAAKAWADPTILHAYEKMMECADGIIVTGPGLEELFRSRTDKPIFILENHLPSELPDFEDVWRDPKDNLRIGWAGSLGHMADLLALLPILERFIAGKPNLSLWIMGNEAIPSFLTLPKERYTFKAWGSMEEYFSFWKEVHIGVAPLLNTPYNRCRSDIKAVEMSSAATLPILSKLLPYDNFIQATGAPSFSTWEELTNLLEVYVSEPSKLKNTVKRCFDHVREKRVGPARSERLKLYEKFMPTTSSTYCWTVGSGFHELHGTPSDTLELNSAQTKLNTKDYKGALSIFNKLREENPYSPELWINEARCLGALGFSQVTHVLKDAKERFPRDPRFIMLELSFIERPTSLLWREILETLKDDHVKKFYSNQLISLYTRQLSQYPELIECAEDLLNFYPRCAELHLVLAQHLLKSGEHARALTHFELLFDISENARQNEKIVSTLEPSYLLTCIAALKGRLQR